MAQDPVVDAAASSQHETVEQALEAAALRSIAAAGPGGGAAHPALGRATAARAVDKAAQRRANERAALRAAGRRRVESSGAEYLEVPGVPRRAEASRSQQLRGVFVSFDGDRDGLLSLECAAPPPLRAGRGVNGRAADPGVLAPAANSRTRFSRLGSAPRRR